MKTTLILFILVFLVSCGKTKSSSKPPTGPIMKWERVYEAFETNSLIVDFGYLRERNEFESVIVVGLKLEDGAVKSCEGIVSLTPGAVLGDEYSGTKPASYISVSGFVHFSEFNEVGCEDVNAKYEYTVTRACQGYEQSEYFCNGDKQLDIIFVEIE